MTAVIRAEPPNTARSGDDLRSAPLARGDAAGLRIALRAAGLPDDDLDVRLYAFEQSGDVVGYGGLEICGGHALLRSIAARIPSDDRRARLFRRAGFRRGRSQGRAARDSFDATGSGALPGLRGPYGQSAQPVGGESRRVTTLKEFFRCLSSNAISLFGSPCASSPALSSVIWRQAYFMRSARRKLPRSICRWRP